MEINVTRREILKFVGGSALGLFLTPLPWKALDDSAIWTQNWPWIPEPGRGDISYKFTTCSLCAASCGVRARCVGNQPVSLSGVISHPLNQGALCPMGIAAHHLRYHPSRVLKPLRIANSNGVSQQTTLAFDEALHEISNTIKDAKASSQTIALLDNRSGRVASALLQQLAFNIPNGKYIPVYNSALDILTLLFDKQIGNFGYDLDNAELILSFGAPLFDGCGTPARTARYLERKASQKQRIIQVETFQSRTARMTDQWIPIRPGTEAVFALGIANVILQEKLHSINSKSIRELENIVSSFTPSVVAEMCGVSYEETRAAARAFTASESSVAVIDGGTAMREAQTAVMMLNLLVGNVGRKGGVAVRRVIPTELSAMKNVNAINSDIYSIPDQSVRVMLIDESLSGCQLSNSILQKKLAKNGIIVSLSPFVTERLFCTQFVIPPPVFLESLAELTAPMDSSVSTISISAPLVPAPDGVVDPILFVQRLASTIGIPSIETSATEALLKKRIAEIHKERRGTVFNASTGQSSDVKELSSPDNLWNALIAGGCWMDSNEKVKTHLEIDFIKLASMVKFNKPNFKKNQLLLVPFVERTFYVGSDVSPLMSKVGQESGLRPYGCQAYINPKTAAEYGIANRQNVLLQTNNGSLQAQTCFDASVMPGIVAATDTKSPQSIVALCDLNDDASIRAANVKIQKV